MANDVNPPLGVERLVIRRWRFSVLDWNDDEFWLSGTGESVGEDDAVEFVGTDRQAREEADRLSDLWEEREDALVAKATYHSRGVVSGG